MAVPWNVVEILEEVKEIHQLMKSIDEELKEISSIVEELREERLTSKGEGKNV